MNDKFQIINPEQITDNTFKLIGTDWMLITAGSTGKFNTMTASWGGLGILWGKKIAFCVVRPKRYTYEFIENTENFTMSFFSEKYRNALNLCGKKSGREVDKAAEAGITPIELNQGGISFEEARLILECRKLYYHDIDPKNFITSDLDKNYPNKDYHRMFVGEIVNCYLESK